MACTLLSGIVPWRRSALILLKLSAKTHIFRQKALIAHILGLAYRGTLAQPTEQFLTVGRSSLWILVRVLAYRSLFLLLLLIAFLFGSRCVLTFISRYCIKVRCLMAVKFAKLVLTIRITACARFFNLIAGCICGISCQFGLACRNSISCDHKIIQWLCPWFGPIDDSWSVQGWGTSFSLLLLIVALIQAGEMRTHWLSFCLIVYICNSILWIV